MWLKACLQRVSLSKPQLMWLICHVQQPQIDMRVLGEKRIRGHRRAGVLLKAAACRYCPGCGSRVRNSGVDGGRQDVLLSCPRAVTQGAHVQRLPVPFLYSFISNLWNWHKLCYQLYKAAWYLTGSVIWIKRWLLRCWLLISWVFWVISVAIWFVVCSEWFNLFLGCLVFLFWKCCYGDGGLFWVFLTFLYPLTSHHDMTH